MESDEFVYILSGEKEETMKAYKRLIAGTAAAVMLALTCGGCGAEKEPVTITIWNYYNGEQLEAFNRMVQNFNDTVGKEQGITVESASQGSVNDLETNVLNAAEGKVVRKSCRISSPAMRIPRMRSISRAWSWI